MPPIPASCSGGAGGVDGRCSSGDGVRCGGETEGRDGEAACSAEERRRERGGVAACGAEERGRGRGGVAACDAVGRGVR
jgi:hypothetical protein